MGRCFLAMITKS